MTRTHLKDGLIALQLCCLLVLAIIVLNSSSGVRNNQKKLAALAFQNSVSSRRALHLAQEVQSQNVKIQVQRYNVTFDNCLDTNGRHRHTIRLLTQDLRKAPPSEKANAKATIAFIDALVPLRDCQALALRVVKAPTRPIIPRPIKVFIPPTRR